MRKMTRVKGGDFPKVQCDPFPTFGLLQMVRDHRLPQLPRQGPAADRQLLRDRRHRRRHRRPGGAAPGRHADVSRRHPGCAKRLLCGLVSCWEKYEKLAFVKWLRDIWQSVVVRKWLLVSYYCIGEAEPTLFPRCPWDCCMDQWLSGFQITSAFGISVHNLFEA